MSKKPRNLPASVRARLETLSRERGEDFQFVLQRYATERLLYRIGQSAYRDRFVLKGARLFALWGIAGYRATRDLDLLGYGRGSAESIGKCFREICALAVAEDGLCFLVV
ncbi:MAG: nucleotidyl transferase AbiEii/AbiGii toxin family protein [Candidatus Eisenbacteria bacterium]